MERRQLKELPRPSAIWVGLFEWIDLDALPFQVTVKEDLFHDLELGLDRLVELDLTD